MARFCVHPDDDAPEFHLSAEATGRPASILPREMSREQLKRLEAALREIERNEMKHERTFTEKTSEFSGVRLFTARCSCGWVGTSAPTKAKAGKGWHRHHEAITGRQAA